MRPTKTFKCSLLRIGIKTMSEDEIRYDERRRIVEEIIAIAKYLEVNEPPKHMSKEKYDGYVNGVWDTIIRLSP
jgi:hypothetical protein